MSLPGPAMPYLSLVTDMDATAAVHDFVVSSSQAFHRANRWFDNSKLAAYSNVASLVRTPRVERIFRDPDEVANWLPRNSFVLKADSGHSAKAVWACEPTLGGAWHDHIRQRNFTENALRKAAVEAITTSRTHCVFVEALLQSHGRLAPDCKVYVSNGRAVLLLLVQRSGTELDVQFLDGNLRPLELHDLFETAEAKQMAAPLAVHEADLQALARLAERLSFRHSAPFCRYDFLLSDDGGWFGEISPMCGALMYWRPTATCAQLVMGERPASKSGRASRSFTAQVERTARAWIGSNPSSTIDRVYYRRFLVGTDMPAPECPYERFVTLARLCPPPNGDI